MKKKTKTVYTCLTNWIHEEQYEVFTTLKGLKFHRDCWKECGVVKLQVKVVKYPKIDTIPYKRRLL